MKSLSDLQRDAVYVEALLRGVFSALHGDDPNAQEALIPMVENASDLASGIAKGLDDIDRNEEAARPEKSEETAPRSDSRTFVNPRFAPSYGNKAFYETHRISNLAYMVCALIDTVHVAYENDCSGIPMNDRGIGQTLEIAKHIAGDLIEAAEMSERVL